MTRPPDADTPGRTAIRNGRAVVALDAELVALKGADVIPYLQTKLTADTRGWTTSGGGRAVATDINGRSIAAGWFVVEDERSVVAIVPTGQAQALMEHLDRFIIMEDVTLSRLEGPIAWLAIGSDATAWASTVEYPGVTSTHGPWTARTFVIPTNDDTVADAARAAGLVEASMHDLDAEEIVSGTPSDGIELATGVSIPLEAGAYDRVSFDKGCYLGQEVIERLHSRGTPARRLCRLDVEGAPGDPVMLGDRTVGEVVRATVGGEGPVALAWVKRRGLDAASDLRVAGRPVVSLHVVEFSRNADH
jgi:folate-binding protein YgfZ